MSFTKDKAGLIKTVGGISLFDGISSNATATPDMDGLMSAADKEKLDGLHNYVHPDSGVIPGKYLVVEVDERGHVIAGQGMKYSTLADFGIADAYINLEDNSVVLGSHRVKVITPDDKVRWDQLVDVPNSRVNDWKTDITYHVNDLVIHDNMVYRCEVEHVSTTFDDDIANWVGVGAKPYIPDWQPDTKYKENEVVVYDSAAYRALTKHISAKSFADDTNKWQRLTGGVDSWESGRYYPVGTVLVNGDKLYQCLNAHTSTVFSDDIANWKILGGDASSIVLPEWTAGANYKAGQLVKVQYLPYIALDTHVASDNFDNDKAAHWQALGGSSGGSSGGGTSSTIVINKTAVNAWQANTAYTAGQLVTFNEALYRAKADHTSAVFLDERADKWDMLTNGIFEWEANKNYFKGMFAVADGFVYQCLVDNQSATPPADDSEHWQCVGGKNTDSGSGNVGAKVVVYVKSGTVVTCTDTSTNAVVDTKTAEDESQVVFDLGYGTYKFFIAASAEGVEYSQTLEITELKMYYIPFNDTGEPDPTAYILKVSTEPDSVIKVTTGNFIQTKTMGAAESPISFVIPDISIASTVSCTKNGVTRTETVSFEADVHEKTVQYSYAKITVKGKAGQTIVISKDSYSYTKVVESESSEYTVYIPELGTWSLVATGTDGKVTNKTISVKEYKVYKESFNIKIFAFRINGTVSDPDKMITYLEENKDFKPAKMNFNTGKFDWGDWSSDEFFIPRPCMLKYDGTVDYYLNEQHYGLKADRVEPSDINNPDYDGNAMMEWGRDGKKIWYRIIPGGLDNTSATVYISDRQIDEDYRAWSFMNSQGEYVDHFYTPIYNGTVIGNKMRSLSGFTVTCNNTMSQEIAYAQANNLDARKIMWNVEVYADITLINLLLMLIGKSTDTQRTFGGGNTKGEIQKTGKLNTYGLFYSKSSYANSEGVKVFGMEHWWGNVWRRYLWHIQGREDIAQYKDKQMVKFTYGEQDGSTATPWSGGKYIDTNIGEVQGLCTKVTYDNRFGMIPSVVDRDNGSYSTYYCDTVACLSKQKEDVCAMRGGGNSLGGAAGAFCVITQAMAYTGSNICAAISCKPIHNK